MEIHIYSHGAPGLLFLGVKPGPAYNLSKDGKAVEGFKSTALSALPTENIKANGARCGTGIFLNSCFSSRAPLLNFGFGWGTETIAASFEKHFGLPAYGNFTGCRFVHDKNDPSKVYPVDGWLDEFQWLKHMVPSDGGPSNFPP